MTSLARDSPVPSPNRGRSRGSRRRAIRPLQRHRSRWHGHGPSWGACLGRSASRGPLPSRDCTRSSRPIPSSSRCSSTKRGSQRVFVIRTWCPRSTSSRRAESSFWSYAEVHASRQSIRRRLPQGSRACRYRGLTARSRLHRRRRRPHVRRLGSLVALPRADRQRALGRARHALDDGQGLGSVARHELLRPAPSEARPTVSEHGSRWLLPRCALAEGALATSERGERGCDPDAAPRMLAFPIHDDRRCGGRDA